MYMLRTVGDRSDHGKKLSVPMIPVAPHHLAGRNRPPAVPPSLGAQDSMYLTAYGAISLVRSGDTVTTPPGVGASTITLSPR